jgi:hypothetical protein
MVNRVWMHHFGVGIVRTASDFGTRCDPPSHPALLDHLARRFMEDDWSLKTLHRRILLSSAYQQSVADSAASMKVDLENRLLWRAHRRRLDFESLRDSVLFVAGRLDFALYGRAVSLTDAPFSNRRGVYGLIDRQNLPGVLRVFDFANPDQHAPQRYTTTAPQQALFLLNSPFMVVQTRALAARAAADSEGGVESRVARLYRLLYQRDPTERELELARRFLAHGLGAGAGSLSRFEQYAQTLLLANEFVFVD